MIKESILKKWKICKLQRHPNKQTKKVAIFVLKKIIFWASRNYFHPKCANKQYDTSHLNPNNEIENEPTISYEKGEKYQY